MTRRAPIVCRHCGFEQTPDITARQRKVLEMIVAYHRKCGYPPNYGEIAKKVGVTMGIVKRDVADLLRAKLLERPFRGTRSLFPTQEGVHERAA